MKRLIILLFAALMALLSCAEWENEFDNPWDKDGKKYNGGSRIIMFDPNGGTVSPTSGKTNRDKKLDSLPTPTRNGYDFDGWYTAQTGSTKIDVNTVYEDNSTIYAHWTAESVTPPTVTQFIVAFNTDGGTPAIIASVTVDSGAAIGASKFPPAPSKSSYTFEGWFSGTTQYTDATVIKEAVTLTAKWIPESVPPPSGNTFTDSRDGKSYKKVTIGTQTWMAQNLNYDVPNNTTDVCYDNKPDSCEKYGRLYNWATAMGSGSSSSNVPSGVQGVCDKGWHLPSDAEWTRLTDAVGGLSTAGRKLKSQNDWNSCGPAGSGKYYVCEDAYGFSALPGGYGYSDGNFSNAGSDGFWWSATEHGAGIAWGRNVDYFNENVRKNNNDNTNLLSVRCVQ